MLFNSPEFLLFFLPVSFLVFWKLESKNQRYVWLTVCGYVFYSFWNYKFCILLAFSTTVSYVAGLAFLKWSTSRARRLCLVIPLVIDLSLLGVFKYFNFAMSSWRDFVGGLGFYVTTPHLSL